MKKVFLFCGMTLFILNYSGAQDCLNINYKLRGYFYVGSSLEDKDAPGGYYQASNLPKSLNDGVKEISMPATFQVLVQVDSLVTLKEQISGFKVWIINRTDTTMALPAQDSRLYMKRQVLFDGQWQDLEYIPSSWCGNSYHTVYIRPEEFWNLEAPCIEGEIPGRFRFELSV